uniref:Laminin G domain-containing protein n=1 Tax=Anolis carolinensis TaxID=28377 RepID=A0A803SWR7_ANOCA
MATFVTKNTSGIILVGLSKGAEKRRRRQAHLPFFSIVLVNGHLAVHVNAGDRASTRKVLVQPDNGTYSDGQEHSVILTRNKRMIMVQVDENSPAEIRLGPLAEARPMNISHLFIGGIPAGEGILGLKMTNSFYGCITNLIFNMDQVNFICIRSHLPWGLGAANNMGGSHSMPHKYTKIQIHNKLKTNN